MSQRLVAMRFSLFTFGDIGPVEARHFRTSFAQTESACPSSPSWLERIVHPGGNKLEEHQRVAFVFGECWCWWDRVPRGAVGF